MKLISSRLTWFHKRFVPALYFGVVFLVFLGALKGALNGKTPAGVLVIPVAMAVFGYFIMREETFTWEDQVFLGDDELIVLRSGLETRIPFSNVSSLEYSDIVQFGSITVNLKPGSQFGRGISFLPPFQWTGPWPHPVAMELKTILARHAGLPQ